MDPLDLLQKLSERDEKFNNVQKINQAVALTSEYFKTLLEIKTLEKEQEQVNLSLEQINDSPMMSHAGQDINSLQAQLIKIYQEREMYEKENSRYSTLNSDLEKEHLLLQHNFERLERENAIIDKNLIEISQEKVELERNLDQINQELNNIQTQHESLDKQIKSLNDSVIQYRQSIQASSEFIEKAEATSTHRPLKRFYLDLDPHAGPIRSICFGVQYSSFWTIGEDKKLIQHNLPDLTDMHVISTQGTPNSFRLHMESNLGCLCCQDKVARILDLSTARIISEMKNHNDQCTDCIWISRNQLLTCSKDRTMKLFDVSKNIVSSTISVFSAVNTVCATESPSVFAAACYDCSIKLIDTRMKKMAKKIEKVHSRQVTCVVPSPLKDIIYSIGADGCICGTSIKENARIFQISHPKLEVKYDFHRFDISPDGGYLGIGSRNGSVLLVDMFSSNPQDNIIVLEGHHSAPVTTVSFAANLMMTADEAHHLCMWV